MSSIARIKIVKAFIQTATDIGVENTTIDLVAKESRCARQTVYYKIGGVPKILEWIVFNDAKEYDYGAPEKLAWKNEIFRLLNVIRIYANLFNDVMTSRYRDTFEESLSKDISERVFRKILERFDEEEYKESCEHLNQILTASLRGYILNWLNKGCIEDPDSIMQDLNLLYGSSWFKMVSEYLIFSSQRRKRK